jgi:sodium/potassium/calcium exchanger 6
MVDLLDLTGKVLNIPSALLGMTLLSWSNSSGDMWADLAIAKLGMGTTALTACYAGPLFNILMGLGIALCLTTFNERTEFSLIESPASLIANVWIMISLIVAIAVITKTKGVF